jgi:hypothetical protein
MRGVRPWAGASRYEGAWAIGRSSESIDKFRRNQRIKAEAKRNAFKRLVEAHAEEYDRLFDEELSRVLADERRL